MKDIKMEEVIRLFEQIKNISGINNKKAIITANKDNELFKECLKFLLDSNFITGISAKKITKKVQKSEYILPTFKDVMRYLKQNNTGTDKDISKIQTFLNNNEEHREFYEQMVTKKYRLGADAKLINKCIPNLIPTWDIMLGTSVEHCKIPEETWFSLSQKLNGNRCTYYNGEFYTRQNKKYVGLDHIKTDIEKIPNAKNYVFDGELIYKNKEGLSDSAAFQRGTGIANNKSENKEELKLVIFDVLPKEEFENKISKDTYKIRKHHLLDLKQYETENIEIVRIFYEGTNQSEIWKWLDFCEENDMEGCMLNLDAPYECKRTKNLMKVKRFYNFDLQIIGYEEGTGRNKGKLGAFIADYKGNQIKVGSGFNDQERKDFWENREDMINRVVTVKYKEISKDKKTGLESLQFPIYCGLCDVGKEVSYE